MKFCSINNQKDKIFLSASSSVYHVYQIYHTKQRLLHSYHPITFYFYSSQLSVSLPQIAHQMLKAPVNCCMRVMAEAETSSLNLTFSTNTGKPNKGVGEAEIK